MLSTSNMHGIVKYLFFSVLTLSSKCLAGVSRVQNDEVSKSSSRSLLYSWDDDRLKYRGYDDSSEKVAYIVISTIIVVIVMICRCCIKYGCTEEDHTSNAVVHPPPRTLCPPPSGYGYTAYGGTTGSVPTPPRTSTRSIILPHEGEVFQPQFLGFDNPNYCPENTQYFPPRNQNPAPLGDVLDMPPPSYDTVVKEDEKYPSAVKN